MKKVVLGSALLVCSIIILSSTNPGYWIGDNPHRTVYSVFGIIMFIIGVILNIMGFLEKNNKWHNP